MIKRYVTMYKSNTCFSFLSSHRSTHLIALLQTHAPSLHDDSTYNIAIQTETYTTSLQILQETLLTSLHHFPSDRIYLYNVFLNPLLYTFLLLPFLMQRSESLKHFMVLIIILAVPFRTL